MDMPWSQLLTQLGVGGTVVLAALWMMFKFLGTRRTNSEKILDALAENSKNQTKLLDKIVETQHTHHTEVIREIGYVRTGRPNGTLRGTDG